MNLQHILNEIEKVDPEVYDRLDTRRKTMRQFALAGKTLAAAAVPFAFGSMFKKAYGQTTPPSLVAVLNYALTLEHLEAEFYKAITATGSPTRALIPAADLPAFETIRAHEEAHVAFLRTAITSLGGTPVNLTAANFDFTGGRGSRTGPFAAAFTNYNLLLAVSQAFEDTGVRAYKGQAGNPNLMNNKGVLTNALQIHSVEARHAAHIRYIRRDRPAPNFIPAGTTLKPWITLNQSAIATGTATTDAAIQPIYNGEEVVTQAGITITNINGQAISAAAASESFDEPLTMAQVLAIIDPFLVP